MNGATMVGKFRYLCFVSLLMWLVTSIVTGCEPAEPPSISTQKNDSATPGRHHYLTDAQIESEEVKAANGDTRAITRLINHYQWVTSDSGRTLFWLRQGVKYGDEYAMINLSSHLAAKGEEGNCREAEALLVRALTSTSDSQVSKIAEADLVTLRGGIDGVGYCTEWLGPKP